jgi:predicted nucleic acid-binding Zn ribbon protein
MTEYKKGKPVRLSGYKKEIEMKERVEKHEHYILFFMILALVIIICTTIIIYALIECGCQP